MRKISGLCLLAGATLLGACGDDGGKAGEPLFPPKPECTGTEIVAYQGTHPQALSKLEIGTAADGFDLDNDGEPDNKLAAVGSIAKSAIDESLANYEIVIPLEFFDLTAAAPDECVKFALYLGDYPTDTDADGESAFVPEGDCNDHDAAIRPGAAEVPDNGKDDNCNGLADEDNATTPPTPSASTADADTDGVTVAGGDCDDTNAMVKPGLPEVCGDGLDNDCDGVADRSQDAQGVATACSPFDATNPSDIHLDPLSFENGQPVIVFKDGTISQRDGKLKLDAGPGLFSVAIPVTDGITLDLRITGATIEADVVQSGEAIVLANGRLGGVIDSKTADTIRGLEVDQIGLLPENSLLDAVFANLLGPLLALPKSSMAIGAKYAGCRTPDIDVDQDGLESYCDSDPDDDIKVVDVCIDGDGTEIRDVVDGAGVVTMQCTEAMLDGKPRFIDGISVELNFETTQVKSIKPPRTP